MPASPTLDALGRIPQSLDIADCEIWLVIRTHDGKAWMFKSKHDASIFLFEITENKYGFFLWHIKGNSVEFIGRGCRGLDKSDCWRIDDFGAWY